MSKLSPIHPGEVLAEEFMAPRGLSANRLALDIRVPANRLSEIMRGNRAITAETALRLAQYFNTSPALWMNLQTKYDLERAMDEFGVQVAREVVVAPTI